MARRGGKIVFVVSVLFWLVAANPPLAPADLEEGKIELSSNPVKITTTRDAYYLQVGIFSVDRNAENIKNALDNEGMAVTVEIIENIRGEPLKKVLVGPFDTGIDAERGMDRVREITGLEPLVIRRGPDYEVPEPAGEPEAALPGVVEGKPPGVEEKEPPPVVEEEKAPLPEIPVIAEEQDEEEQVAGARKPKTLEKPRPQVTEEPVAPQKEEKPPALEAEKPVTVPVREKAEPAGKKGPGISLDFTDVDISVLIKFISEVTGKNFIYDEKVRGNITIISPKKITQEEMYRVFLSVLQVKGFTTVEQGNIVKIIPSREAKQEGLKTFTRKRYEVTDEFITQLIPLKYIDAKDASPLLTPLISKEGLLTFYGPSNTLIIIDRGSNIARIADILSELDIGTAAQVIKLYQLQHAPSDDVSDILSQLYTGSGVPVTTRRVKGRPAPRAQPAAAGSVAGTKFISDARTNSIVVLAPSDLIEDISDMITQLDIPTPENVGKINVYYLENADSEELATVLNNLISGRTGGPTPGQPGQPSTIKGIIAPEFEGPIKITADKATNSLLIIASPVDYLTLVEVIKKLDIKRRQVYVESVIMEVRIDKGRDLGVEYRAAFEPTSNSAAIFGSNFDFSGNVNDLLIALAAGNPLLLAGEGLTAGVIGGTVRLPDGTEIPAITAILRAAEVATNVNVLATPHLLTTDNQEAEIVVGENVPFITSQARDTTNLSNIINTVEREDVGITLRITPQIHESDFVKLDIYQETSAIKEGTAIFDINPVGPTTTKRSAKTNIIVKSGQTIVVGGLMQEVRNRNVSKIPILGDIPLIGALFRFESDSSQKTNLLIFLTPKIIKDVGELEGVTLERKELMRDYIRKNLKNKREINIEEYNKVLDPWKIDNE
ncbi:MAG: type II secretion system secretin GspD [Deltaproteobacteria bacterium]|nr:type II secretion system secretin GspD [Deltaproteobacteria bacterium]NIS78140.1 type II secretion system secretin GspD [Deltaproteobacteria bacterium]